MWSGAIKNRVMWSEIAAWFWEFYNSLPPWRQPAVFMHLRSFLLPACFLLSFGRQVRLAVRSVFVVQGAPGRAGRAALAAAVLAAPPATAAGETTPWTGPAT